MERNVPRAVAHDGEGCWAAAVGAPTVIDAYGRACAVISRRRRRNREADLQRINENERLRRWVAARARALELEVDLRRRSHKGST